VLEWHKWTVTLDELQSFLQERQFTYVKTIEENEEMGTAAFHRLK
jgi:hypothetical protein